MKDFTASADLEGLIHSMMSPGCSARLVDFVWQELLRLRVAHLENLIVHLVGDQQTIAQTACLDITVRVPISRNQRALAQRVSIV